MIARFTRTALLITLFVLASMLVMNKLGLLRAFYPTQHAIYSATATIVPATVQDFLEVLSEFAEDHGFEIDIGNFPREPDGYIITLRRKDVWIAIDNPFENFEFGISFYEKDFIPVADDVLELLTEDLKERVISLDGATYEER